MCQNFQKKFVKDIAQRTKNNLETYQGDYDVTQLINSAVGLIMISHANFYTKIDNSFVSSSLLNTLRNAIKENSYPEDGSEIELRDIIKHIRNGIAHSRIYFEAENHKLNKVIIKDHRNKYTYTNKENKKITIPASDFKIVLNVSELRELMITLSETIISSKNIEKGK